MPGGTAAGRAAATAAPRRRIRGGTWASGSGPKGCRPRGVRSRRRTRCGRASALPAGHDRGRDVDGESGDGESPTAGGALAPSASSR